MNLIFSLITHFILFALISRVELSQKISPRDTWLNTYDFIVVGAGTAGTIVAARLAEDSNKTVLLIEAGGERNVMSDIPALMAKLAGTNLDWSYPIVSQPKAMKKYIDNKCPLSRGKAFGGCSMHNDMNYYRESPEYWEYWTELSGAQNWKYSDVLPYFKNLENNLDENLVANDPKHHSTGGPIFITSPTPDAALQAYLDASPGLGYPITHKDGREPFGSTIMQTNIKDGVRQSTALVFLDGNQKENLHILGQTLVTKILFNEKKRAIGVEFSRNNESHKVYAKNEVIVSAGTPGSPHLLLLSGIGPNDHLQELNIKVVSDRNVGEFRYPIGITLDFSIKDQSSVEKPIENADNYYEYFVEKRGPLAYKASGVTCFKEVHFPGRPNLSHGCVLPRIGYLGTNLEEMVEDYKLKDEWKDYYRPYLNQTYFQLVIRLRRPRGSGTMRLASVDPLEYPIIDPRILREEQDVNDLVKTVNLTLDFFTSPAMSEVIEIFKKPIPGCKPCADQYFCDSYLRCMIKTTTNGIYPKGGCPMGVANNRNAVVDERLKVFGVSSLRVIDESILPLATEQTAAITMMIGEKGANMIKEDNHMTKNIIQN